MSIDWTIFDGQPEDTCTCKCGRIFRSHSKIDMQRFKLISRKPCPACGKADNLFKASSDPESFGIGAPDVGQY